MTPTERFWLYAYAVIVAAWPIRHLVLTLIFRRMDFLTLRSPRFAHEGAPRVSAIIPAKDEEAFIADCVHSVRAQSYPNLEILVADDRSEDGTGAIARAIAAEDPRVRVITIERLPEGWTGKTHALHVAAGEASGEWLWFLDADTRHTPDSLSIVMEYARQHRAALASLLPEMRCETFWERVVQPLMGIVLMRSYPLFRVNDDVARVAFANGQYILVERSAYEAAGGHEAVRDRFVEDIYLAKRVKALGHPIRTAIGTEISSTRMYTSLPQIVRGWSRILYDALGRSPWQLFGKILEPLIWSQTVVAAFVAAVVLMATGYRGPFPAILLGMAVVHLLLQISVLYRFYRLQTPGNGISAVWYPLAGFVSDWILLRAMWSCWTGRVTWRNTSYGAPVPAEAPGQAAPRS